MPRGANSETSASKRLDNLLFNMPQSSQKDNSDLKGADIGYSTQMNTFSRNLVNNGDLCSIKEDHAKENSASSFLMDKPIRSLRDIFQGIRNDIKEKEKHNKRKAAQQEQNKGEETKSNKSFNSSDDDDVQHDRDSEFEIEMDDQQKKIVQDKVVGLINFWNDIDKFEDKQRLHVNVSAKAKNLTEPNSDPIGEIKVLKTPNKAKPNSSSPKKREKVKVGRIATKSK